MIDIKSLFAKKDTSMSMLDWIDEEIREFEISNELKLMVTGENYYRVDNDIFGRVLVRRTEDGVVEEKWKSNNKLAHGHYKNLVDEKINYLLGKEYSLTCLSEEYLDKLKKCLGKYFLDTLNELGYEASNKGLGWLQVYIDEAGKFKTMVIPAQQCIPIWKDNSHKELESMIRFYNQVTYEGKNKKIVTKIEHWTEDAVEFYIKYDGKVMLDSERILLNGGPISHYLVNGTWKGFGKVPFVCFKNNRLELPDIKFVKSLVDGYDKTRSDVDNYLEDVKNLIFVLKGYGGENLAEFMQDLNYYRAINIDDPQDGGVDTLNPEINIDAAKIHFEQLKRDIIESGQGVNKDLDKFGSSPSGIALKFLYAQLDLKCNALEVCFKRGFENLLYFVNVYLGEVHLGNHNSDDLDVDIIFNRDIAINETEAIDNCTKSAGTISNETIVANHPWVKDVRTEIELLEEEKKENEIKFDSIPFNTDGEGVNNEE